jgi:hypothetical protein
VLEIGTLAQEPPGSGEVAGALAVVGPVHARRLAAPDCASALPSA